ncbi:MAG: methionine biosynthesis protein MetW [Deltaproteobacteria bacterium RBG_19FT_COMBO_46_12]|nr:MAG: methionine biosynthesis protein MetW [Deltaproteobacteria bacterium RBG_19FT_COMBO_46_12]
MQSETASLEHRAILKWIRQDSSVLDLGCGNGELLALLVHEKRVQAQGIEIDEQAIYQCVAKGLNVFHEDIDNGLSDYADHSFDYVILNQSFQQAKKPDIVLKEALRVGQEVIIGFPNFAHYQGRLQIFFKGKTPITPSLPYAWHDTPNLHFLSISDFIDFCLQRNVKIKESFFVGKDKEVKRLPNLFALAGIFLVTNGKASNVY